MDTQLDETSRAKLDKIVQKMATNKESDDTIQTVVNDFKQKYGKSGMKHNPVGSLPVIKQANQFGAGVGAGLGKTLLNIPKAFLKFSQGVSNAGSKIFGGKPANYQPAIEGIDKLSNALFQQPIQTELDSGLGKAGKFVGETAPYLTGVGGVTSKLANATSGAKVLQGAGALKATGRVLGGATAEGLANYGAGYALSGGDAEQAKNQALISGALKGGLSTIGEIANATKLPESMVGKIFKTNKKEVEQIFKTGDDNTIAKQVLDRGIVGNTKSIAKQLTDGMADSETKIGQEFQRIATENGGNAPTITLENPKGVLDYLKNKANLLRKSGAIKEAQGLELAIPNINPETGKVTANSALGLRRFLDGLRYEKSFASPTEELTAQQAGLKEMSEEIRHKINQIGGTGDIMKDYQFYIKALDKLASHATRIKNNDALGIINSFLLGEGIANLNPQLMGVVAAREALSTTGGATKGAQLLKNLPKSSPLGSGVRSGTARLLSGQ